MPTPDTKPLGVLVREVGQGLRDLEQRIVDDGLPQDHITALQLIMTIYTNYALELRAYIQAEPDLDPGVEPDSHVDR